MGNYTIIIEGTGQHGNGDTDNDAECIMTKALREFKKRGHNISHASFTASTREIRHA